MREPPRGHQEDSLVQLLGGPADRLAHHADAAHGREGLAERVHEDGHKGVIDVRAEDELQRLHHPVVHLQPLRTGDVDPLRDGQGMQLPGHLRVDGQGPL